MSPLLSKTVKECLSVSLMTKFPSLSTQEDEIRVDIYVWLVYLCYRLCVLDHGENGMLHIFNTYGHKLQTITKVNKPHVISTIFFCVDRDGNFVISDTDRHSLTVFDSNGDIIRIIGQEGERLGDLKYPRGVCCRVRDNKYLTASSNEKFTIQMF